MTICVNNCRHAGSGGYDVLLKEIQSEVSELMMAYVEKNKVIKADTRKYLTVLL